MTNTSNGVKVAFMGSVPQELISEIQAMRRNPDHFHLRGKASCSLGCDGKGEKSTYQLGHTDLEEAGSWCPQHGWLSFNSTALLPTERLTPSEIEDRRLGQQRKRGPRK